MPTIFDNCFQYRYKKQRGYNPNGNCVVIKFLPIPLAVMIATIILKVKPVEAEFALQEFGTNGTTTLSVLFTTSGSPVDPTKMASILSKTFNEFGLEINMQDLRHALEAFAHKFSPEGSSSNPIYAELANHAPATSYRYGRDQNCFVGIPADISMANSIACNNWNSLILDSPSLMSSENKPKILKSLRDLELISLTDIHQRLDTSDVPLSDQSATLDTSDVPLSYQSVTLSPIDKSQCNRVHTSVTSAANVPVAKSGGADQCLKQPSSDMSPLEYSRMQRLQSSPHSDKSPDNGLTNIHQRLDTSDGPLSDQSATLSPIDKSQCNRVHTSVTSSANVPVAKCCGADRCLQQPSSDMSPLGNSRMQRLQSSPHSDKSPDNGLTDIHQRLDTNDVPLSDQSATLSPIDKSQCNRVDALEDQSLVGAVICFRSPPTQIVKRVRNEQEIQGRKLIAQKRLKLFEGMRPMQKQALQFLERSFSSAFILLPTGSGKTHLIWSHKKEQDCAVIFVPYRMLASQQQSVFESNGLTVTWPFQSYPGSMPAMLCNVHFAILPYEAASEAVSFIASLNEIGRLGPIWVDEVCLFCETRFHDTA